MCIDNFESPSSRYRAVYGSHEPGCRYSQELAFICLTGRRHQIENIEIKDFIIKYPISFMLNLHMCKKCLCFLYHVLAGTKPKFWILPALLMQMQMALNDLTLTRSVAMHAADTTPG